ncbi:MAG: hypothetical protein KKF56_05310 [Nanoarchaeota archaeon]|nr:hypothetical protein [Nanoarchaeota archaeon]
MGKIIAKKVVDRKAGFLYYVDGQGNVCQAEMKRGKKGARAEKRTTKKPAKKTTKKKK